MLDISILTRQGVGVPVAAVRFGEDGGTIGRADTNKLVLDDPDRTVSRVHAQVVWRSGSYVIIDRGSNPLQLNGRPIGVGNQAPLQAGDRLLIGGFELLVSQPPADGAPADAPVLPVEAVTSVEDPFSHLLDGLVAPSSGPAARPHAQPPTTPDPTAGLFPDPLSDGTSSLVATDPFADLLGAGDANLASVSQADAAPQRPDNFSDLVTPTPASGVESIDSLFGLGAPLANDPLSMTPLGDPLMQPNTASAQDPLAALTRSTPAMQAARGDHLSVDAFAFVPPAARIPTPMEAPSPELPVTPVVERMAKDPVPVAAPVTSGDLSAEPAASVVPPAQPGRDIPAVPAPADSSTWMSPAQECLVPAVSPSVKAQERDVGLTPTAVRSSAPAVSAAASVQDDEQVVADELLAAFLRGLGPMQQAPALLTPGLMERVGDMLRTATEGTLQLLHTRQEFKHQVRAQVTVIAAQANNPLKFSPTVEVALAHLLGPGVRGFMPAEAAMRDAWQDLRAHEFGVMVGMRAALEHVIQQFSPEALEQNIAAKSRLDAIFSANRKAKLWDQFVKLYADIAREAEDDFHTLFGKAFLKAYEEQLDRLKVDGRK